MGKEYDNDTAQRIRDHFVYEISDGTVTDVDTFVQLLGHTHGALGGEAQFARGFLLQR